jgi:hypothetical protein
LYKQRFSSFQDLTGLLCTSFIPAPTEDLSGLLEFFIESGAIGDTTIRLFNYLQDSPVEVTSVVLNDMSKTFTVPVEKFITP